MAFLALGWSVTAAQTVALAFEIRLNAGAGLTQNQAARDAFERAAMQWVSRISDPFTVFIDADLGSSGFEPGVIGSASTVAIATDFDAVRNALVMDALDESDDAIVAALPTRATFNSSLPPGFSLDGRLSFNKANGKAFGFSGLDAMFGELDGTITFNQNFGFDFDNRDGVGANLIDFESVAAHEIGHVLGFVSVVDEVDILASRGQTDAIAPYTFDLFRFQNNVVGSDPMAAADFTTAVRYLHPGGDAIFDDAITEFRLSTGQFTGDGNQASHFKEGTPPIGLMDPTIGFGEIVRVSASDLRVMDLIGYDIQSSIVTAVPEPGTMTLMGLGLAGLIGARRRKKKQLTDDS